MKKLNLKKLNEIKEIYGKENSLSILRNYQFDEIDFVDKFFGNVLQGFTKNKQAKTYFGRFYFTEEMYKKIKKYDVSVSNFCKFCLYTLDYKEQYAKMLHDLTKLTKKDVVNVYSQAVKLNETEYAIYSLYGRLFGVRKICTEELLNQYIEILYKGVD